MEHYIVECRTGEQLDTVVPFVGKSKQTIYDKNCGYILISNLLDCGWRYSGNKSSAVMYCQEVLHHTPHFYTYNEWHKVYVEDKSEINKSLLKDYMIRRFSNMFNW